jgi:hypothetical protein
MSDIDDAPPCLDLDNFALAINTKPFNVFHYKTAHSLEEVLEPGYFAEAVECLIRRHDRIEVVASADGTAEFATLIVRLVTNRGGAKAVEVSKLERH